MSEYSDLGVEVLASASESLDPSGSADGSVEGSHNEVPSSREMWNIVRMQSETAMALTVQLSRQTQRCHEAEDRARVATARVAELMVELERSDERVAQLSEETVGLRERLEKALKQIEEEKWKREAAESRLQDREAQHERLVGELKTSHKAERERELNAHRKVLARERDENETLQLRKRDTHEAALREREFAYEVALLREHNSKILREGVHKGTRPHPAEDDLNNLTVGFEQQALEHYLMWMMQEYFPYEDHPLNLLLMESHGKVHEDAASVSAILRKALDDAEMLAGRSENPSLARMLLVERVTPLLFGRGPLMSLVNWARGMPTRRYDDEFLHGQCGVTERGAIVELNKGLMGAWKATRQSLEKQGGPGAAPEWD